MFDPFDTSAVSFPDIDRHAEGSCGLPYVYRFDSGRPGPHAMISAVVHGNEVCGVHALDWLLDTGVRPECGVLSLAFVNVAAYRSFDPARPLDSRYVDEDFNRLWDPATLDGDRDSVELRRARELRGHMDTVDRLLDLHSMSTSGTPVVLAGPLDKGRYLAEGIGLPQWIVMDTGHDAGTRLRDYRQFGDPQAAAAAALLETGPHFWGRGPALAMHAAARFLETVGVVDAAPTPPEPCPVAVRPQRVVRVDDRYTVRTDAFRFTRELDGLEVLDAGVEIARDGDAPVTVPFDGCVMVMPSPYKRPGETAVRFGRLV
jgi:predicted deacylase